MSLIIQDHLFESTLIRGPHSLSQVRRRSRRWPLRRYIRLCQPAINQEISSIDETALIARQKHHRLRLLDSFAEAAAREVHFTTEPLLLVITEEVLEQGRT